MTESIDPDNIPKLYGGNLDWNFGDLPALDPEIERCFGVRSEEWPRGPAKMVGDDLVVVGRTKNGGKREEVVARFKGGEVGVDRSNGGGGVGVGGGVGGESKGGEKLGMGQVGMDGVSNRREGQGVQGRPSVDETPGAPALSTAPGPPVPTVEMNGFGKANPGVAKAS